MKQIMFIIGLWVLATLAMAACNTGMSPEVLALENVVAAPKDIEATPVLPSFQSLVSYVSYIATPSPTAKPIDYRIPTGPYFPPDKPSLNITKGVVTAKSPSQASPSQTSPVVSQAIGLGIGFTFPDGTIDIKAAAYEKTYENPYSSIQDGELTPVGLVQIGEGGANPGIYEVNLDLEGSTQCVSGELKPLDSDSSNPLSIRFVRIEQVPNPERDDETFSNQGSPLLPYSDSVNSAVITADSVCFVLKSGGSYFRYCSVPGSDLSPKNNKGQYSALVASIRKTATRFGLQYDIEYSQTISTLEDPGHIEECNSTYEGTGETCHSDITAAPVTQKYLLNNFGSTLGYSAFQSLVPSPTSEQEMCKTTPPEPNKKTCKSPYTVHSGEWVWKIGRRCNISPYAIIDANGLLPPYWLYPGDVLILPRNAPLFPGRLQSNLATRQLAFALGSLPFSDALASYFWQEQPTTIPISVTVGVVKVHRLIHTGLEYSVYPGDYRLDYWFDGNKNFFAATLSGFRDDGSEVSNLQIPAVPAAFLNADGTEQESAQISACRIFRRCVFFQKRCP